MGSFRDALETAGLKAFCQASANNTQLLRSFADVINAQGVVALPTAIADVGYTLLCDKRPDPPLPPPFSGGQCRTQYLVTTSGTLQITAPPSTEPLNRTDQLTGPILGITQKLGAQGQDTVAIVFVNGAGDVDYFNVFGTTRPAGKITSYQIDSVVRVDGQPDNCGNPPPVPPLPPPAPGEDTVTTPITWVDINGNTVTNNLVIAIGLAYVDATANIQIPIKITVDAKATVNGTLNVNLGGLTINLPGSGQPTGKPGNPSPNLPRNTNPTKPTPTNPVPDPPDPPDPSQSIVGAIVTVVGNDRSRATQIIQKDNPDIFAPYLGFIQFLVRIGDGTVTAWTSDIPIKNYRNLIPCPWDWGAIDVRGSAISGVEFDITPIYEKSTTPPKFFS